MLSIEIYLPYLAEMFIQSLITWKRSPRDPTLEVPVNIIHSWEAQNFQERPSAATCGSLLTVRNQWCLKLRTKIA